eukprot:SAG11_NODE_18869_length_479_cov_1.397368_1_plen_52_part_10
MPLYRTRTNYPDPTKIGYDLVVEYVRKEYQREDVCKRTFRLVLTQLHSRIDF